MRYKPIVFIRGDNMNCFYVLLCNLKKPLVTDLMFDRLKKVRSIAFFDYKYYDLFECVLNVDSTAITYLTAIIY